MPCEPLQRAVRILISDKFVPMSLKRQKLHFLRLCADNCSGEMVWELYDCGNRNFSTPQLLIKKGDLLTVNDVGWNFKNKQIIQNYNNWLSKGDSKEIHWANLKRQYLQCYDYWKTVLEGKTLSEDEMKNKGSAWKLTATSATTEKKGPWTETTKFIYARKTKINACEND